MPFCTVSGEQAGPDAVGILVPPGRRTVVVVRPRSLDHDLLLVRRDEDGELLAGFHEAGRGEAAMLAENLSRALTTGTARFEVSAADGGGVWVRCEIGAFPLIVCGRAPGQPYRPLAFADEAAARPTIDRVRAVLSPAGDVERQVYLNTQHFSR
jgi:hypothetical protein